MLKKISKNEIRLIAIIIFILLLFVLKIAVCFGNKSEYRITVIDKTFEIGCGGNNVEPFYLVNTKLEDGSERSFKVAERIINRKQNAFDIYTNLEAGKTYTVTAVGFEMPLICPYQSIIDIVK